MIIIDFMRILGIDPGMAIVGYGILDYERENLNLTSSGSIQTKKGTRESSRLLEIYNDMETVIQKFEPDAAAIEKLFFFRNRTTVMPVAHARGVILMVLEKYGIPVYEYTPMEVKQVLTGYGRANKKEVQQMVEISLKNTKNMPKLDDTVDAIAIAICHTRNIK